MNKTSTLNTNCIDFVNELGIVITKTSYQRDQLGQELYTIKYNGYIKVESYIRKLSLQFKSFCDELLKLPLVFPDCESRKTFFLNLYKRLLEVKERVKRLYKLMTRKHPCRNDITCSIKALQEYKDKAYNEKLFKNRKEYQNYKVYRMYLLQKEQIKKALHEMQKLAVAEKIDLSEANIECCQNETIQTFNRKYKTDLSLSQLSHAFNLFFECVCPKQLNKRELANFIALNFETPKTKNPSKNQVYKKFFEVEDSTKEPVKKLVIEMLNKANKN